MESEEDALSEDRWKSVPDDLIVNIIARLPFPSLPSLCSINSRFLSVMSSDRFLHRWTNLRRANPWLLLFTCDTNPALTRFPECLVFDIVSGCWHKLALDFLPRSGLGSSALASDGGLLLLVNKLSRYIQSSLIVCNLVTRSWSEVHASWEILPSEVAGFVVDKKTKNYRIVVVGDATERRNRRNFVARALITRIYESETGAWRAGATSPMEFRLDIMEMIACRQHVFCRSNGTRDIFAYNVKEDVWKRIGMPEDHEDEDEDEDEDEEDCKSWLVRCCGMLMLIVGSVRREGDEMMMIWKLDEEGERWMKVEAMALQGCNMQGLCKEDCIEKCVRVGGRIDIDECVGVGSRIWMLSSKPRSVASIVFEVARGRWSVFHPPPPHLRWRSSQHTHVQAYDLQPAFHLPP